MANFVFSVELNHLLIYTRTPLSFGLLFVFPRVSNCQFAWFLHVAVTDSFLACPTEPQISFRTFEHRKPSTEFLSVRRHSFCTLASCSGEVLLYRPLPGGHTRLLLALNLESHFAFRGPLGDRLRTLFSQVEELYKILFKKLGEPGRRGSVD